jgi:hypothetical protein
MNVNDNMGTEEEHLYVLINILEPVHCKQGLIKFLVSLFSVIHKDFIIFVTERKMSVILKRISTEKSS